jgi:hypothetical protein
MQYAYLVAGILFLSIWIFLFVRRKDLHREMLTMSLMAAPLAFADFFFVPKYWQPVILFHIPVGFEGVLYSFCLGGITAVLYSELAHRTPRHIHKWHKEGSAIVLALTFIIFLVLLSIGAPNPMIAMYVALLAGIAIILYLRKDLLRGTVIGGLCFGVLYFILIRVWITIFPNAGDWFVFQGLPVAHVFGVPLWELLFGVIFAAYWGNVYELIFGYRLVAQAKKRNRQKKLASSRA